MFIVVDVLSFSTAVDIAVSNGTVVFPYWSRALRNWCGEAVIHGQAEVGSYQIVCTLDARMRASLRRLGR
jgi:hypothetical protein